MKAIGYSETGPAAVLRDLDLPKPFAGPRDLIVRVEAMSVNPADTKLRRFAAPPDGQPRVLGFDAAGVVESVGSDVALFRPGDEVFYAGDIMRSGTNAEFHAVDERIVGHKPRSLSFAEAAALPLTAITAWEILFERLRVLRDASAAPQTLLVIGGAGGVGSILIQIARRLTNLTVIATASRPETVQWVEKMGANAVINHRFPLHEELKRIGIPQVDLIASLTASDRHYEALKEAIKPQGHIALIDDPDTFDIVPFKRKSVTLSWEFMFTRAAFQTPDMIEQHRLLNAVAAMVDRGELITTLTQDAGPVTAANLIRVHEQVETGSGIGKTVLSGF
ncbi:zinc-binding alcohol dehydrogenase family protein [Asticcacaulis sp. AND118]|uniref:zinc-binding alcohol dehydrogenase family protein n=1 Tax=Asticcacaulis sp. AND118 TaxID=2840468 RepID=UPI001CFF97BE|nr:zinc-binding alcohol dehydrogenase family protein [Asticcacaulis sp. AND118]UDF05683.1 zinc-binding alcohol dehydrogenase family protein [Asticcacaulis sp. AND118]